MSLAEFIRDNNAPIILEWESFARTLMPAAEHMGPLTLRNHIKEILNFIVGDIQSPQTPTEQVAKSRGAMPEPAFPTAAEIHASLRFDGGFNMDQMVSEFRALRASIAKLWYASVPDVRALDIRELTRFDEAIDQAMTEAIHDYTQKLDTSRGLFLGILSHDLRNPLGAISMAAQLTLKIGSPNEKQTMLQSQIIDSVGRATEIVTSLLDLTRARLGSGLPIITEATDVGFIANRIVDEMRILHPAREFKLSASGPLAGMWDKARIGQVFSNVLGNATQYGFTSSPITIALEGRPREVVISIHNEGVPINSKHLDAIFDSMTRGDNDVGASCPSSLNLGLGLFICREIITAHRGTIAVASSETEGTTFTIHLPRVANAPPIPLQQHRAHTLPVAESPSRPPSVRGTP